MKKMTTTKRVLLFVLLFCAILEIVIVFSWVFLDRMDAAGLAGVIASPAAVVIGFYEWKAKAENIAKYGNANDNPKTIKGFGDDLEE